MIIIRLGCKLIKRFQQKQSNESLISEYPETTRKQPAWWQPAIDWMIHGNPILRIAVAVLMVGIVLLLRFASEHWQLSLGVKLGFYCQCRDCDDYCWLLVDKKRINYLRSHCRGLGLAVVFSDTYFFTSFLL